MVHSQAHTAAYAAHDAFPAPTFDDTPAKPEGEGNEPKYVTVEDMNRAITARLSDFSKRNEKSLKDFQEALTGKLAELLPKAPEETAPKPQQGDIREHPEFKGLLKKLEETTRAVETERNKREASEARSRDTALRTRLNDALTQAGIKDPLRIKHAVSFLVDSIKAVHYADDNETIVFKDDVSGDVDFATGLKAWMKSEDAKLYLPAPSPEQKQAAPKTATQPIPLVQSQPGVEPSFEQKIAAAEAEILKLGGSLP